jgi:RNA polymerase sigma factor (sigma-70 family)
VMQQFEELYVKYHDDIYRFLLKLTGYQPHIAEEIVQETFYQAYISIGKFKGQCHIKTWICKIAKNTYFLYLKKNNKTIISYDTNIEDLMMEAVEVSPQIQFENKEIMESAMGIIHSFDIKTKEVMLYRLCSDLPYSQIAKVLGISESSARVIYHRGKIELQNKMKGVFGYEI